MSLQALERFSEPLDNSEIGGMREENSIAQGIGKVLRNLRKRRDLSLNDLAKLSGVSRSMLSQMETGRSIPSVLVLCKIASTFEVPVTVFLKSEDDERPTLLSAEETPLRISADGKCAWRSLTPGGQERNTEFFELTLRGGGIEDIPSHPQGVWVNLVVSKGSLVVVIGGRRHQLAEGDVLDFHASGPYALINSGNVEALVYLVLRHP